MYDGLQEYEEWYMLEERRVRREMAETRNAKCRRKACTRPHANCRHSQTGDLYCEPCAAKINRANPEHPRLIHIPRLHGPVSPRGE